MTEHEIPLPVVVTPTKMVTVETRRSRPEGIDWKNLPQEKSDVVPVLKRRK